MSVVDGLLAIMTTSIGRRHQERDAPYFKSEEHNDSKLMKRSHRYRLLRWLAATRKRIGNQFENIVNGTEMLYRVLAGVIYDTLVIRLAAF